VVEQIRNVACLAGNIVTASPISDLNPVLQAAHAVLTLVRLAPASSASPAPAAATAASESDTVTREVNMRNFFLAYRKVDMAPEEVLTSVFVPFTRSLEYVRAFKQARRRDDDISIVTSSMCVRLAQDESADGMCWMRRVWDACQRGGGSPVGSWLARVMVVDVSC
jgi:xanthine dehydrogenase/oxidase